MDYLTFTPRAGGIDFYGDNLFTTEEQLRRYPARVRAFRQASLAGWEYALAHREEMIDLILREFGSRKSRDQLQFEAERTVQLMHPDLIEPGHMNPGRWRHIANTYAELGMMPRKFDLDGFLFEENPRPELGWLYWTLGATAVVALAGFGWALPLVRLNRRLEKSEREFRQLSENAPFPVVITDFETSQVLFLNRLASDLFGSDDDTPLVGDRAVNFYDNPGDRNALIERLRASGTLSNVEMRLHTRDGRPVWAAVSVSKIEFRGRPSLIVALHDITQRRAMEDELRRSKDAAEAADAAKGRYLGVLSHEVRTPLNGMLGMIGLLRSEELSPDGRENLAICEKSGEALLKLVTDLLDFARFDSGRVELEKAPLQVSPFVRDLCALFRPAAEAKGLALRHHVHPNVPPIVLTDAIRLRQVLSNLLANAIKFTETGWVEITVEAVTSPGGRLGRGKSTEEADGAREAPRLRFHINDTGIGIAPERLNDLFEPYVQADVTVSRRYGGTGLGLSISKRLAQLLGGGIAVQSSPGAGSLFTVEIEAERG